MSVQFSGPELCLDNTTCDKHTVEGKLICKHGLCEMTYMDFFNDIKTVIVCPLEMQRIDVGKEWTRFMRDLPKIKKALIHNSPVPNKMVTNGEPKC